MRFGQRFSAEVSATREERSEVITFIDFEGQVIRDRVNIDVMPVDVTARYHFRTPHIRWRPYAGLGARWVQAPSSPVSDLKDRVSPMVIAGVDYNMTPVWSLRADAKRLLRGDDAPHDPLMKIAIGVGYRF
jgi:outer membrane protein W